MTNLNFNSFGSLHGFTSEIPELALKKCKHYNLGRHIPAFWLQLCHKGVIVLIYIISAKKWSNNHWFCCFWCKFFASVSFWRLFPVELGSIVVNLLLDQPCYYHNAAKDEEVFFAKNFWTLLPLKEEKRMRKDQKGWC